MTNDLAGDLFYSLRRLVDPCLRPPRRPAPSVRRIRGAENRPLIVITQREDTVLLEPAEARRLARRLLHIARD